MPRLTAGSEEKVNVLKVSAVSIATAGLLISTAFASDTSKGKALFKDPKLGGARAGSSCDTCHSGGSGLETAGGKKEFKVMGKTVRCLEDTVNSCIEGRMKGKALGPRSENMAHIAAYIKSLKGKARVAAPEKRTAAAGC